jgi:hypothetical protein
MSSIGDYTLNNCVAMSKPAFLSWVKRVYSHNFEG